MKEQTGRRPAPSGMRLSLAAAVLAALVAAGFLVYEVLREFRQLSTASSDNTHWVLSQTEVEFLEFRSALVAALHPDAAPTALDRVVVEFDVFYSRMTTLGTGQLYTELRTIPGFSEPVTAIRAGLDAMIPTIDGPRDELATALPRLLTEADAMRLPLREMATTGLQYFSRHSDDSRTSVADTLLMLAVLTAALLLALLLAIVWTRRASLQTERRGRQLAEAYARLNTVLETSLDAVIVTDMKGRVRTFNPAAEKTFGYQYDEVYGKNVSDIIIPDHFRNAHEAGMARMRGAGEMKVVGHGRVRLEARRRNGDIFPVELALQKARAGDDEVVIGFLRDISHRVAAENEIMESRDRALAGEKAKAEFLAMMTHEIRTPLNGLLGNLALLKQTPVNSQQAHHLRNMDISGALLMHHVDAVLDVARFEAGAVETQEDTVHLGQLLQDIVDAQASAAEAGGNRIGWEWSGAALTWVRLDASRLRQVLVNLVGNAIKFTRDGRIQIEAEALNPQEDAQQTVEIRVIDTGIGIAEDEQAKVFDDFHTINPADGSSGGGTGLGLGIARRFVQALGGEIGVESTPGDGSVFWVRVPLSIAEAPEAPASATQTPCPETAPCRILLVEDNEINLDLAHRMLRGFGHSVTEARDGRAAVTLADAQRFDLILMDIRMPVLNGLDATGEIRAGAGPNADTPIIAVSANVLPEARDRFVAAGMSGFLAKPLDPDSLARVIARFAPKDHEASQPDAPLPGAADGPVPSPLDALIARYQSEVDAFFSREPSDSSLEDLAEEAHRIAGSAAAFAQTALRAALVSVEIAAESGDAEAVTLAMAEARAARDADPAPSLGG
ncbi:PAS domain-containing hybrid sensor histidine kinase/response regulator [Ponticoccus alexandrii]|nr:PAS domain-containing hybrid sensor histidine kinase/response regulator [Ponticoccus alexandrii]